MLFKALSSLVFLCSAFLSITSVLSAPIDKDGLTDSARKILSRATPAAPHFVIYSDEWVSGENGPPSVSEVQVRIHH